MEANTSDYARLVASAIDDFRDDNGMFLSHTDLDICAQALRFHASRRRRRASLAVVCAMFVFATFGLGLPDLDHDGRVGLSDLAYAARGAIGLATPAAWASPIRAKREG